MILDDIVGITDGDINVMMFDKEGKYIETEILRYDEGYDLNFLDDFGKCSVEELWGDYDRDNTYHEIERVYVTVVITVEED